MKEELFDVYKIPQFQNPSLIVGWQTQDIGKIATRSLDFVIENLEGEIIAEIKLPSFFSLGGAGFENDIIQVPESKLWACKKNELFIFKSNQPEFEWYKFLYTVLDLAEHYCKIREFYTISGTISPIAHTSPRRTLAVFNQSEFQERLRGFGLEDMTWEGPPAISSYLLWTAKERDIPGASLWPEVPFYLAAKEDPEATHSTLSFLNEKFALGLNLRELDEEIKGQNEKLAQLREQDSEVNRCIGLLEQGISLNEEEQRKLNSEIYNFL